MKPDKEEMAKVFAMCGEAFASEDSSVKMATWKKVVELYPAAHYNATHAIAYQKLLLCFKSLLYADAKMAEDRVAMSRVIAKAEERHHFMDFSSQ
jgi:hypothetical protein